jgi:hypothetical protein
VSNVASITVKDWKKFLQNFSGRRKLNKANLPPLAPAPRPAGAKAGGRRRVRRAEIVSYYRNSRNESIAEAAIAGKQETFLFAQ